MFGILIWQMTIAVFSLSVNSSRNIKNITLIFNLFILFIYQSANNTQLTVYV